MFKRKRSPARTVLNVFLTVALLLGIAFLGYSVGKPIMDFMRNRPDRQASVTTPPPGPSEPITTPTTTTPPPDTTPVTTEPEPEPDPKKGILFVSLPDSQSYDAVLEQNIGYAVENNYYGIALELLADGGTIGYNTANESAIKVSAVSSQAINSLSDAAKKISDAGLLPYARLSVLTDHILSWADKSICYLFENSTSTWLDNSLAAGGQPWISAFSENSRSYISSLVSEISEAGFAGIIAGELEFPPFRRSDLGYVGAIVQSADRYTALAEFSNVLQDTLGSAKSYAVEVNAEDIVAGRDEVLNDPSLLNCNTIYVRYDSAAVGTRLVRADGTEVSYSGLGESDKATVVFRSVAEELKDSGKTLIPAVSDESLIPVLSELGYDETMILIY